MELPKGLAMMNVKDLKVMIEVSYAVVDLIKVAIAKRDCQWNEQNK